MIIIEEESAVIFVLGFSRSRALRCWVARRERALWRRAGAYALRPFAGAGCGAAALASPSRARSQHWPSVARVCLGSLSHRENLAYTRIQRRGHVPVRDLALFGKSAVHKPSEP